MNLAAKIATGATAAVVAVGLLALTAPAVVPFLPHRVQVALAGPVEPIDTVPGTVDDLFRANGLAEHEVRDSHVSHADVDALYVAAAKVWPWSLPAGFMFPGNRGVADTPGPHYRSMGLQAAFSKWATASLDAVQAGDLDPAAADERARRGRGRVPDPVRRGRARRPPVHRSLRGPPPVGLLRTDRRSHPAPVDRTPPTVSTPPAGAYHPGSPARRGVRGRRAGHRRHIPQTEARDPQEVTDDPHPVRCRSRRRGCAPGRLASSRSRAGPAAHTAPPRAALIEQAIGA